MRNITMVGLCQSLSVVVFPPRIVTLYCGDAEPVTDDLWTLMKQAVSFKYMMALVGDEGWYSHSCPAICVLVSSRKPRQSLMGHLIFLA
jgi:hypothetical protein